MANEAVEARELKNRLGSYLRKVRLGESLVVTKHGRPVAELRPLATGSTGVEARLAELAALGFVTPRERANLAPFSPIRQAGTSLGADIVGAREDRL
jgi:prevent-host-death family protein